MGRGYYTLGIVSLESDRERNILKVRKDIHL